eukprot:1378428-Amphidinium_carterae.1
MALALQSLPWELLEWYFAGAIHCDAVCKNPTRKESLKVLSATHAGHSSSRPYDRKSSRSKNSPAHAPAVQARMPQEKLDSVQ